jgi:hypothetical protein
MHLEICASSFYLSQKTFGIKQFKKRNELEGTRLNTSIIGIVWDRHRTINFTKMKISFVITAALSLCLNGANSFTLAPLGSVSHSTSLSMSSEEGQDDRRAFIKKSLLIVATLPFLFKAIPDAKPKINYADVSADIADLIRADPNKGPTLVRLAWHSSGTYDKMTKTGGSTNGTIRFKEELSHGSNAGLEETAVAWMEPIREKYGDGLSYADLYTLSGGMYHCLLFLCSFVDFFVFFHVLKLIHSILLP